LRRRRGARVGVDILIYIDIYHGVDVLIYIEIC
jgi:hypothetical protein